MKQELTQDQIATDNMKIFINNKPFNYTSGHGTIFAASRCDFGGGVRVVNKASSESNFASDLAEMIGYHALFILPELNGFQGYDCINWKF